MAKKTRRSAAGAEPRFLHMTIEQLERSDWGEPSYDSYVVRTVRSLRKKPLHSFSDEELRLALSQRVGLPWVAELAIQRLEEDPFRGGDFHHGDVLEQMLRLPTQFAIEQPSLSARLKALAVAVEAAMKQFEHDEQHALRAALASYLNQVRH
jgi:hypothetical protein